MQILIVSIIIFLAIFILWKHLAPSSLAALYRKLGIPAGTKTPADNSHGTSPPACSNCSSCYNRFSNCQIRIHPEQPQNRHQHEHL